MILAKYRDYDPSPTLNRLESIPSQTLDTLYQGLPFIITLDSGATVSYIRQAEVIRLSLPVFPNAQLALLADMRRREQGEVQGLR